MDEAGVERLRAVIRLRMDQRGMNVPDLALLIDGNKERRDRFYKALDGAGRGLTPETLFLIAEALGTTPLALKRQADVLTPAERDLLLRQPPTKDIIDADPLLSEADKRRMLDLYDRLTREVEDRR